MKTIKLDVTQKISVVTQGTNHIFIVDVSGSMYNILPKMRSHLKNKLALIVKPEDTVTIIYFASKGQYGTVIEHQPIATLSDLTAINTAIDKYLVTRGCTGYVEPILLATKLAQSKTNNKPYNLVMMTDGYENEWPRLKIIESCESASTAFQSITFIEYGWYCNRQLIAEMAEAAGATHVFSEDYQVYEPVFETAMGSAPVVRREVDIAYAAETAVMYLQNDNVVIVKSKDGKALVPENIDAVYVVDGNVRSDMSETAKYIALYYAIHTMNSDMAWNVLKLLGDVKIIKKYSNCFSKQEYSNVKELVKEAIFDTSVRFEQGVDYDLVPDENAFTVFDVLELLQADTRAKISLSHPSFSYKRTGKAAVQKQDSTINDLSQELINAKDKSEIQKIAAQIASHEDFTPTFVADDGQDYVSVNTLVFNESRPNVSIQTSKQGYIELPKSKTEEFSLPEKFPTLTYRNYTIIRDGILNVSSLPIFDMSTQLKKSLKKLGVNVVRDDEAMVDIIDLSTLPIINRAMVKSVSAKTFFSKHLSLQADKALMKVLKHRLDELSPRSERSNIADAYGKEAAEWLSSIGIRDYGFSPKVELIKSEDYYISKELNVKIAGCSSLPSVNAVMTKINKNSKLNLADQMMKMAFDYCDHLIEHVLDRKDKLIEVYQNEMNQLKKSVANRNNELTRTMFSIIIGQVWFDEFDSLDDNNLDIQFMDGTVSIKAVLEEKQINI